MTAFDLVGPLPLHESVVLEASAGTGKTAAIAGLVARYVAEGHATLPDLMIATFSGASTRELRSRVRAQLLGVQRALAAALGRSPVAGDEVSCFLAEADPTTLTQRHARVQRALDEFDSATICTTHQFCDRMLAELGVLVDHEPGTTLLEDISDVVTQCVADEYLARYAEAAETPFDFRTAMRLGSFAADRSPTLVLAPWGAAGRVAERVSFAEAVRTAVDVRKRQLGIYTFDDMQVRLRDALGTGGAEARRLLQQRYPFVLIDEFQDTDPVQWQIVDQAFVGSSTVVLIGDPKQSIYGFRGADVRAYLSAAQRRGVTVRMLGTNHRSDPRLVQAVSRLLDGAELGLDTIRVTPVTTSPMAPRLLAPAPWCAPLRIRAATATTTTAAVNHDLVADVAALLESGAQVLNPRMGETQPLSARDIAVIVSTNRRGAAIRTQLSRAGIPAVFNGSSSVLRSQVGDESQAADDWRVLLAAFERPRTREVRAVTLTDFVGWTPAQLATADDAALGEVSQSVRLWHRFAVDKGFAALYEMLTSVGGLAQRILARSGGDRTLTDLRHVADLLQAQQTRGGTGLAGLRAWLAEQKSDAGAVRDERSTRLETDQDAVRIMTIHQAKGLQFPVVYLPDLSHPRASFERSDNPYQIHLAAAGGNLVRALDVGGKDAWGADERRALNSREESGEELRKLYVALTRAECLVVTWWLPNDAAARSPLHRILFRETGVSTVPDEVPVDDRTPADLDRLTGSGIAVEPMTLRQVPAVDRPVPTLVPAARLMRQIDLSWRRTSYSALSAHAHQELAGDLPVADEPVDPGDALPPEAGEPGLSSAITTQPPLDMPSPMADLPGGVGFGSLVHAVFEHVDPSHPDDLEAIVATETARLPVPGVAVPELVASLLPAFDTPLGPLFDNLRLRDIPPRDRLPELDFELPLGAGQAAATMGDLVALLERHLPPDDLLAGYAGRLREAGMTADPLRGYLTGSIDAAVRVGERIIVVDYKTNRLAPYGEPLVLGHYTAAAMAEAMMASHYPLQALLYSVALHRFLRWRWRGYDPHRQLGGVGYLFVRGMAGPDTPVVDGMRTGVFTWQPPTALVTGLSDLLAGRAA